jgi:antitoxin component HigA of HigAB toxin-antitoxin module
MDIRPIRDDADYTSALKEIAFLRDAADGTSAADKMEVLAILVEDFANRRQPFPQSSPIKTLNCALNEMGRTQSGPAALLGSLSRAWELLSGKRPLTLEAGRKISAAWNIPVELFIARNAAESAA